MGSITFEMGNIWATQLYHNKNIIVSMKAYVAKVSDVMLQAANFYSNITNILPAHYQFQVKCLVVHTKYRIFRIFICYMAHVIHSLGSRAARRRLTIWWLRMCTTTLLKWRRYRVCCVRWLCCTAQRLMSIKCSPLFFYIIISFSNVMLPI